MDMSDIKKILEDQGKAFDEFKKTNDQLIQAKADGKAIGDLEAKLEKLGSSMDSLSEMKSKLEDALAKLNRPSAADAKSESDLEKEVKAFNQMRVASNPGVKIDSVSADEYKQYCSGFWELARKGNIDWLKPEERKAMSVGTDSDGGYLVPAPTVGRIVQKVFDLSPIRQIATVMTISTDSLEGINDLDEAAYGWVGETAARPDTTTPTVGKYRIEAHEMYAQPKATQKLLDDAAVDIEGWLAGKVADKFARAEGAAFITGTGAGMPRGLTTYPTATTDDTTRAWGTLQYVKSGANGSLTSADALFDLIAAFKNAYLQNANWVTRREVIALVRKLKDTTNQYLWQPGLQAGQPDRLLGYPIVMAQDMPALGTNSPSLAFGDFEEGYTIVDRIGMRTLRDPFTDKPFVKFYTTKRTGGGVLNFEAIKLMQFAN